MTTFAEPFIHIQFQEGPVGDNGVNGCQVEDVLNVLLAQLTALQERGPCRETALAITKVQEARMWLNERTAIRKAQGVEGTQKVHVSVGQTKP